MTWDVGQQLNELIPHDTDAPRRLVLRQAMLTACRLGWEARGKRDAEVCRKLTDIDFDYPWESFAIAIERDGKG